jgi:hypothetical protein
MRNGMPKTTCEWRQNTDRQEPNLMEQALMKQNGSLQKQLASLQTDHETLLNKQSSTEEGTKLNGSLQKQLATLKTDYDTLLNKQSSTDEGQRRIASLNREIINLEELNQDIGSRVDSLEAELQKTLEAGRANILELETSGLLKDKIIIEGMELKEQIEELEVSH